MRFSDLIIALDLLPRDEIDSALARQSLSGRPLGDILVDMGLLTGSQITALQDSLPAPPDRIADLGIEPRIAFDILVKFLSTAGHGTTARVAETLAVPRRLASVLLEQARAQGIVELKPGVAVGELRVELTPRGRSMAAEAFATNAYIGPLPVSLAAYAERVRRQTIRGEMVLPGTVAQALHPLAISDDLLVQVGIAVNSGRAMLLYGAPGNGKTTIAERMVRMFGTMVLVPHCFEVAGQIVKVYDPAVHDRLGEGDKKATPASLFADEFDPRWVACRRPFVSSGGELSLDMLDLKFDPISRFYEAPLHVKAQNGVLLIDDFGRQLVSPAALLNRWVVPMDRGIDFLKLHTGQSFQIPFDQLLVFSTNLSPRDLMDAAFLRRLPYKINVHAPTPEEFAEVLRSEARVQSIAYPEDMIVHTIRAIQATGTELSFYQAVELPLQIAEICSFARRDMLADRATIGVALGNLLVARDT